MFKNLRNRRGFTLAETLVTVAIVAVLAAVVVPAVTQQITKGEDGQFVSSLQGVVTSVTSYAADTRRFPLFLSDLSFVPQAGDSSALGTLLTATEVASWRGPYSQTEVDSAGTLALGFNLDAEDHLRTEANFLVATLSRSNGDSAMVVHVDSLVDGGDGLTSGKIRWALTGATFDSAWVRLLTAR